MDALVSTIGEDGGCFAAWLYSLLVEFERSTASRGTLALDAVKVDALVSTIGELWLPVRPYTCTYLQIQALGVRVCVLCGAAAVTQVSTPLKVKCNPHMHKTHNKHT